MFLLLISFLYLCATVESLCAGQYWKALMVFCFAVSNVAIFKL